MIIGEKYVLSAIRLTDDIKGYISEALSYKKDVAFTQNIDSAVLYDVSGGKKPILDLLDRVMSSSVSIIDKRTVRIEVYRQTIETVDLEDWSEELKFHALKKLSIQEIEVLGLWTEEVYRRLKND